MSGCKSSVSSITAVEVLATKIFTFHLLVGKLRLVKRRHFRYSHQLLEHPVINVLLLVPDIFMQALIERKSTLKDVVTHQILPARPGYFDKETSPHIRHDSLFISGASREAVHGGWADLTPNYFHEIPKLIREYWPADAVSVVDKTIGGYVAELIDDGSTLQIGKILGIHTEMVTEGILGLAECGAVNNSKKTLNRGKLVGTFAWGSKRLYEFMDCNPMVEMHPVDYTNDPYNIGRQDNMVAINATIEIDLLGQCCSESMGPKPWSGTGGQVDFFRGANISNGGKGFVTMPSTAKSGTISRIVPMLNQGAVVTTSKNDVDHVVTEYGVAKLRGKNVRERALALNFDSAP
ncbi:4-hydroxybutyrate coenzyme A transferase [Nymphon striatum]|nr:4-hydroxybutyrate coenzyme A transferase [Nymphon striatum]